MARVALVAAFVAILAASAMAQLGSPAPTCPPNTVFIAPTNPCIEYNDCLNALCQCATGAPSRTLATNPVQCLVNTSSTLSCASLTTCFGNTFQCLTRLANVARANTSHLCNMWAITVHSQVLAAATTFGGSQLQRSCAGAVCQLRNITGRDCNFGGENETSVCTFDNLVANGTTPAPSSPITGSASAISVAAVAILATVAALF